MIISSALLLNKTKADFQVKTVAEVCACRCPATQVGCSVEPSTASAALHRCQGQGDGNGTTTARGE